MEYLTNGPKSAETVIALAHGAGAPMDSPFMDAFAAGLSGDGRRVVRFEFPYMAGRRETGKKRPPDRQPVLLDTWRAVAADLGTGARLVVGGKSMGGRMASLIADEVGAAGLVCLGYPFHAPGKPERPRTEHLADLKTPGLIVQGTRDPFGTRSDVDGYALSDSIAFHWSEDGDHNLKPRRASGRTERQNWDEAVARIGEWLNALT